MKTPSQEQTIDVDPGTLGRMIREAITDALMVLITDAVHERLDYMRGRVR